MRISPPRALVYSAFALAALAAGCGGGGALDYGTSSINTAGCTGTGIALYSPAPNATSVPTSLSSVIVSFTSATVAPYEVPTNYDLELEDDSQSSATTILGTLTPMTAPTGAPTNVVYMSATVPSALTVNNLYYVTLYDISSTCQVNSFASFHT